MRKERSSREKGFRAHAPKLARPPSKKTRLSAVPFPSTRSIVPPHLISQNLIEICQTGVRNTIQREIKMISDKTIIAVIMVLLIPMGLLVTITMVLHLLLSTGVLLPT